MMKATNTSNAPVRIDASKFGITVTRSLTIRWVLLHATPMPK